jgi:hypothetical protein
MRITGYTFRADIYCPTCIGSEVAKSVRDGGVGLPDDLTEDMVETALDRIAEATGIDRDDEFTFDSDAFPKVIFSIEDDDMACGSCGNELG